MNSMKKYDFCLMNPPYGYGSNLAVAFMNKAAQLSDEIYCIVPRTMRKSSILNSIDPHLHLVSDKDNDGDAFGIELYTCSQHWVVKDTKRAPVKRYTKDLVSEYFEFTDKKNADIAICANGRYQAGQVFVRGKDYGHLKTFDERSENTHHFIKVLDKAVIKELSDLQDKFYEASRQVVAQTSLCIDDIVKIYIKEYCDEV